MAAVIEHTEHGASIPSEGELMKLLRSRDGTAFRLAFKLHGPLVKAIAFSVLRDRWLAEDTVQETFAALWTHADELDPALGSVAGWLHTVAHRRAVDRLRREVVRRETTERSARLRDTGLGQDPAERVIERVDAAMSRTRVRDALAALPVPQREVLLRMYFPRTVGIAYREGTGCATGNREVPCSARDAPAERVVIRSVVRVNDEGSTNHSGKPRLSRLDAQILSLVAEGYSDAEIAVRLHSSQAAVERRLVRAMEMLDSPTRVHAALEAIRRGLIG